MEGDGLCASGTATDQDLVPERPMLPISPEFRGDHYTANAQTSPPILCFAYGGVITVRKNVALLVGGGTEKNAPSIPTEGRNGSVAH